MGVTFDDIITFNCDFHHVVDTNALSRLRNERGATKLRVSGAIHRSVLSVLKVTLQHAPSKGTRYGRENKATPQ